MGRHGSRHSRALRLGRLRIPVTAIALCVLLLAVVGLGIWWWFQRSVTDPIDAAPVSATATVLSSPSCLDDGDTTVRVSGLDPAVVAVLDGCGFTEGQRISVEYQSGRPEVVRLAGTTRAGPHSLIGTMVPIGIVIAGLAAAVGLVAIGRAGSGRLRPGAVSVAQLRARMAAGDGPHSGRESGHPRSSDSGREQ